MSDVQRLAQTTLSIDDIPPGEREEYLMGLPPARLRWALFEAANRVMPDAPQGKPGNDLLFYLLMAVGSFGIIAADKSLKDARENALADIAMLVPVILRELDR